MNPFLSRSAVRTFLPLLFSLATSVLASDATTAQTLTYRETFPAGTRTLANVGWSAYVGTDARDVSGASAISGGTGDRAAPAAVNAGVDEPSESPRGFAYVKEGGEGDPYLLLSDEMPPMRQPITRIAWRMNLIDPSARAHAIVAVDADRDGKLSGADHWLVTRQPVSPSPTVQGQVFSRVEVNDQTAWADFDFQPGSRRAGTGRMPTSVQDARPVDAWPAGDIVAVGIYSPKRFGRPQFDSYEVWAAGVAAPPPNPSPRDPAGPINPQQAKSQAARLLARYPGAQPANALSDAWPAMTAALDQRGPRTDAPPWNPTINPPVTGRTYYVHADLGDDRANGRSADAAWRTLQHAVDQLEAGDALIVGPGAYYQPTLHIRQRAGTQRQPIYIRAEPLGEATVSSAWPDAAERLVQWVDEGHGTWSAPFPARDRDPRTFGGFYAEDGTVYMLFGMQSLADLMADAVPIRKPWDDFGPQRPMPWPGYGFALENGRCWLRTPRGEDPNGKRVVIATHADHESSAVLIDESPHLILDGLRFEGAGDKGVKAQRNSPFLTVRNAVFEYCRHGVGPDDHGLVEWCEYTFPGYKRFADELARRVKEAGVSVKNPMFGFVKRYHAARTEGHLLGRPWTAPRNNRGIGPRFCEGRYNFSHQSFDGDAPGAWSDSAVHHSVYLYQYDNAIEMEAGPPSPGRNVHVHDNLIIASLYGAISHQDTTDPPMGPQWVYRNVFVGNFPSGYNGSDRVITGPVDSAEDAWDPWVFCKFLAPKANQIGYAHNLVWLRSGGLLWAKPQTEASRRKMLWANNVLIFERGLTNYADPQTFQAFNNAWAAPSPRPDVQGPGGLHAGSIDALKLHDPAQLDFRPRPDSPLIDAGRPIPDLRDAPSINHPDLGPFEAGHFDQATPGDHWPRPRERVFNAAYPERLTESETNPDLIHPSAARAHAAR